MLKLLTNPVLISSRVNRALCTLSNGVRTFEDIPGPVSLPVLGSLYLYKIPGFLGGYKISEYHNVLKKMHEKYGPLVKEYRGSSPLIHVFNPEDAKTVFNVEGKSPVIPPLQEATQFYRKKRELSLGLGNTNGEEWYRLRSSVQKMMLRPKEVYYYLPLVDSVAQSFLSKIDSELDENNVVQDLRKLVGKWILESSGMICFEKRLGAFDRNEELIEKLIAANREIFIVAGELKLSLPIYKYVPTPRLKRFFEAEDFFYSQASNFIQEAIESIKSLSSDNKLDSNKFNFLTYLLSRKELSLKDVSIITFSLFGDGLSTTTPTFLFNLYMLAKHPQVQERVYSEIEQNFPSGGIITVDVINSLQLLKAVIKETLRLYPNGTEVSRIIQSDLVLSNYRVPAGTHIDLNQFVLFRSENYFQKPEEFIPERWLRADSGEKTHPFLFIPFGHGTRMCAGRRFAEQDLYVGLTRILQKYRLELVDPQEQDLEQVYQTLLFPKDPIKIKFLKR